MCNMADNLFSVGPGSYSAAGHNCVTTFTPGARWNHQPALVKRENTSTWRNIDYAVDTRIASDIFLWGGQGNVGEQRTFLDGGAAYITMHTS